VGGEYPWHPARHPDAPDMGPVRSRLRVFLPWHRAYLAWFEETIRVLTGDHDWAVPYWDYSVPGDVADRSLPAEFGVATRTVGGTVVDNPLFVGGRNDDAMPVDDIDIVGALSERRFVRSFQRGFGGVDPVSRTGSSRWDRTTSSTSTSAG
jgi:hypothetical protein